MTEQSSKRESNAHVRADLIQHLRDQIAAGKYETEGKLKIVVDRLAAHLQRPKVDDNYSGA